MKKPFNLEHALKHGCETESGLAARIICTDRNNEDGQPVVALLEEKGGENSGTYTLDGFFYSDKREHGLNLINIPIKHKRKVWMNFYADTAYSYPSEKMARNASDEKAALAVAVPVEVEFVEGQGL